MTWAVCQTNSLNSIDASVAQPSESGNGCRDEEEECWLIVYPPLDKRLRPELRSENGLRRDSKGELGDVYEPVLFPLIVSHSDVQSTGVDRHAA